MVGVQSSIGSSKLSDRGVGKKFTVDNAAAPRERQELDPNYVAGLRREMQENQERTERKGFQDARRRIEIITGIGRKTKDVQIEGSIFTLRTLKTFEQNCLAQVIEGADRITLPNGGVVFKPTSMYNIKVEALGHAIYMIDGQNIDVVLGTSNDDYEIQLDTRKDLIREMDNSLIDYLFVNYEDLMKESVDGYMPKNVIEAEEVVDTIRKSGQVT